MTSANSPISCPKCSREIPPGTPGHLCPACLKTRVASQISSTDDSFSRLSRQITPPNIEALSEAFPDLEIIEVIGYGGMSIVYQARQKNLGRLVALKLLPEGPKSDPAFADRFQREARFLGLLNHPNIVTVYDFGKSNGFYFLIMEFVDGVNLRQALRAGGFSPAEVIDIIPKICLALEFAHERGVTHRDIKPENILLDTRGRVKIADFGIAKLVGKRPTDITLTQTNSRLGTPHYMAPEQIEKPSDVDHRADVYSLGVLFYEMLAGELPLGRFAPPSKKAAVDVRIDAIVFRALERDRENRYQSITEIRTEIEQLGIIDFQAGAGTGEKTVESPEPSGWRIPAIRTVQVLGIGVVGLTRLREAVLTIVPTVGLVRFSINRHQYWTSTTVLLTLGTGLFLSGRAASRRQQILQPLGLDARGTSMLSHSLQSLATADLMMFPIGIGLMLSAYVLGVMTSSSSSLGCIVLTAGLCATVALWLPLTRPFEADRQREMRRAPAPRWLGMTGILFVILGAAGIVPSLFPWNNIAHQINTTSLAIFAGVALLTRSLMWRRMGIGAAATALAIAASSNYFAEMASGTAYHPDGWTEVFDETPNGIQLALASSALRYAAYAAAIWTLTGNNMREVFGLPPQTIRRALLVRVVTVLLFLAATLSLWKVYKLNTAPYDPLATEPIMNQSCHPVEPPPGLTPAQFVRRLCA